MAGDLVWSNETARSQARRLAEAGVECTIFNYAVWAFPQFSVVASHFAPRPILLLGQINPSKPGMVALLAAAGALEQIGVVPTRVFGDVQDEQVSRQLLAAIRAAHALHALRGETYGLIGGRSIGINTAVSNTDQWAKLFGVDVEHIDQYELVVRSERLLADASQRITSAREWLESKVAKVHYDGRQLTPQLLERQIAAYYACLELIEQRDLDFLGIKGQPELTERFATMDVAEAFLNDPYDWDGPKEPVVCATEADMDGALTMEVLKHIAGSPVLFADVRHYYSDLGIVDLVNSGQHPTYFAGHTSDLEVNLRQVELRPQGFYFPAGGASVFHLAAPGRVTLARLSRLDGSYRMHILRAEFVRFDEQLEQRIVREVQPNWPHAFASLECRVERFLEEFPTNHIHAVYGDYVPELMKWCEYAGIEPVLLE